MSSNIPADLQYARSHEWVRLQADGQVQIGISDHAQQALGDLVFVELPEVGRTLALQEAFAVVESVKAASDVYAPVAGVVTAVNPLLTSQPELINQDPYGRGWIMTLKPATPGPWTDLLSATDYKPFADEA